MTDMVLVLLLDPAGAASCLAAAGAAARALADPLVTVLHVRSDPSAGLLSSEEVLPEERRQALAQQAEADAVAIHAAYLAWQEPSLPSRWEQMDGIPAEVLATRPPVALVVLTLPTPHAPLAERAALDVVLFTSGQPVLTVPAGWGGGFGRHLAIGWRDTPGTRRAIDAARPWLTRAERVAVLAVGAQEPAWPDRTVLDLPAERVSFRKVDPKAGDEGDSLLAAVAEAGADGLVMGAYRRSRVMEWIVGGVTRHIVHAATLPVLMVH